ncbi:MAG TPA: GMC family oxidoreductase [Solirubrobacteraceae bacterium]|jgi:choline dehydrogenase-like flavoprotein
MSAFADTHAEVLRAFCDTIVPSIESGSDADGFFARTASSHGVDVALGEILSTLPEAQQQGLGELLGALVEQGFPQASQRSREQILRNIALMGPEAAAGVGGLVSLTLFLHYGLPDQTGQNPNWKTFGYPGPVSAAPQTERALKTFEPDGDTTLEADVCIVGSGAGGGVIAGVLSGRGLRVVVLEAGGYFDDADFHQLELPAYQNTYWRGGPQPTADMNLTVQAGSCLGGGTTINWTNSLRTTPWVREQWESEFGLEGLAGAEFDRHLDAVWQRLGVNDRCSDLNLPQQRMKAGAERLDWSFRRTDRNIDESRYSFDNAGYIGFGDQSGAKQSTVKTYLKDANDDGALLVTHCWAERILTADGRAEGVQARCTDPETGTTVELTVRAPNVVVAAGALESPALLLRSKIGGPAVGDYLRLHPCTATVGFYPEDLQAWRGAPHAGLLDEFADVEGGHGFLIEGAQYAPAISGSAIPFSDPRSHRALMSKLAHGGTFIGLLRDRGHGRVTIDEDGMAVVSYAIADELDLRNTRRAIEVQTRLHEAAGAQQILALAAGVPTWRWGEDVDAFIARIQRIRLRAGGWKLFSAHQMGTCRMGQDPASTVADTRGELHDTKGVWIGDASAFPTASGTNPMITIMALAHRTAEALAASAVGATAVAAGA